MIPHPTNMRWTTEKFVAGVWKKVSNKNKLRKSLMILPNDNAVACIVKVSHQPTGDNYISFYTQGPAGGWPQGYTYVYIPVGVEDVYVNASSACGFTICEETYEDEN